MNLIISTLTFINMIRSSCCESVFAVSYFESTYFASYIKNDIYANPKRQNNKKKVVKVKWKHVRDRQLHHSLLFFRFSEKCDCLVNNLNFKEESKLAQAFKFFFLLLVATKNLQQELKAKNACSKKFGSIAMCDSSLQCLLPHVSPFSKLMHII